MSLIFCTFTFNPLLINWYQSSTTNCWCQKTTFRCSQSRISQHVRVLHNTNTHTIKWQWQISFNQKKQLKCERHEPVWKFKYKKLNLETIILFLHPVFKTGDFIMQHAQELKLKQATTCVVKLFIVQCFFAFEFWMLVYDIVIGHISWMMNHDWYEYANSNLNLHLVYVLWLSDIMFMLKVHM